MNENKPGQLDIRVVNRGNGKPLMAKAVAGAVMDGIMTAAAKDAPAKQEKPSAPAPSDGPRKNYYLEF
jgi:hypothetical protein